MAQSMNRGIHDCTVIDAEDLRPPDDPYAKRLWKLVRFARAGGCSDAIIRQLIQRDIETHPLADEQMIARLVLALTKWRMRQ